MKFVMFAAAVAAALACVAAAAAAPTPAPPSGKSGGHAEQAHPPGDRAVHGRTATGVECPTSLHCDFVPAAYAQNSASPYDYGNYDLANRPQDGLTIRYVVVHDTESSYESTLREFQNPLAYVSAHYVTRSADGHVTQLVPTKDVAWQAGNWYVNTHSVGIENEGYALDGSWFTDALYGSLAKLIRYQADRYGIPLDREHVIGHDQVPGIDANHVAGMHWDPGPYFDWAHLMALAGAPITAAHGDQTGRIVTIDPAFATNLNTVTGCSGGVCAPSSPQPTNFVYLHTQPSVDSPLVSDPLLTAAGVEPNGVGTTKGWDWGDKAVTGETFAVAARQGDWTAIWYGGQEAWFQNDDATIPGRGIVITPKAGLSSIPVYGTAYPTSISTATEGYTIPAGQQYIASDLVGADHYTATTYNAPSTYHVDRSDEQFYAIQFNHRLAYVRATDVDVLG
jgi:N-acetyl-anhydromuramyl-L-alanine amidase AmpD